MRFTIETYYEKTCQYQDSLESFSYVRKHRHMKKLIHDGNNFIYLTVALILILFTSAIVAQYAGIFSNKFIMGSTVAALIICTYSIRTTEQRFIRSRLGIIVTILAIATAEHYLELNGLYFAHLLFLLSFYIWIVSLATRQVLFTGSIDANKIIGAVCIYLLVGIIWAILYMLILQIDPQSFSGLIQNNGYGNFPALLYFSFITLTTLGYGDISPTLPISQFLTYMEAITGQFYIAILVASLIGAHFSEKRA